MWGNTKPGFTKPAHLSPCSSLATLPFTPSPSTLLVYLLPSGSLVLSHLANDSYQYQAHVTIARRDATTGQNVPTTGQEPEYQER